MLYCLRRLKLWLAVGLFCLMYFSVYFYLLQVLVFCILNTMVVFHRETVASSHAGCNFLKQQEQTPDLIQGGCQELVSVHTQRCTEGFMHREETTKWR